MNNLIELLMDVIAAKREHDEASAECDYEWGYHGQPYIKQMTEAGEAFEAELSKVIDERIALQSGGPL